RTGCTGRRPDATGTRAPRRRPWSGRAGAAAGARSGSGTRAPAPAHATVGLMTCRALAIWDERYLAYDFGDHPLNPVRLDLTVRLARELGVLDRLDVRPPEPADEQQLLTIHDAAYLDAVRRASDDPAFEGFGLGTTDDPVFPGMYDASALVAGGSAQAALRMWRGEVEHAVNIAGGLHHAMRGYASGFCIFNDVVLAIRTLLAAGAQKVAYVDVDVHHGD